jgi:hypothetical protein
MKFALILLVTVTLSGQNKLDAAFIDPDVVFTDWAGWGSSLAWFGDVLGGMPQDVQDEIIDGLFSV